jgi:DNA-binding NarL/FixJ family response regulator
VYQAGVVAILAGAGFAARPIQLADLVAPGSADDAAGDGVLGPPRAVVLDASLGAEPYARDLVARLAAATPRPAVVLVVAQVRPEGLLAALEAGARALVHRWCEPEELVDAVRAALAGSDRIAAPLAGLLRAEVLAAASGDTSRRLSAREHQVLRAMATGGTNAAIGRSLGISEHTVRNHVRAILAKLEVTNRTDAVTTALRRGLVDLTG